MEFAGLVVGIASLFSVCVDVIEYVKTYKSFGTDSRQYLARFEVSKLKLREWADSVGVVGGQLSESHHERLDIPEVASVVKDILYSICEIFEESQETRKRLAARSSTESKSHPTVWSNFPGTHENVGVAEAMSRSRRRRIEWTIKGKVRFADQVDMMEALVKALYDIVTPATEQAKFPSRLVAGIDSTSLKEAAYAEKIFRITMEEVRNGVIRRVYRTVDEWLDTIELGRQYDKHLQDRLEGTCDWIFDSSTYCQWASIEYAEDGAKFLWVHGPAGHGKSVICARLYERLQADTRLPCAYWAATNHVQAGGEPKTIVRYWLSQLSKTNEVALDILRDSMQSSQVGQKASEAEVWAALKTVVTNLDHCTLVLDGLDEYGYSGGGRKKFLQELKANVQGTNARCLIVSRLESDIELELREAACEHGRYKMLEYRITKAVLQADIILYSNHVVQIQLPKKEDSFRNRLAAEMAERCEGMFLMIKLQQDKLRAGKSQKALQNIVESWPTGLNQAYDRSWANIENLPEEDRSRAISILRWAVFARRPLTVAELTEALIVESDVEYTDFPLDDLPDDIDDDYIDGEIKSLCSSLVEIRSRNAETLPKARTVHIVHPSVKEYLVSALPMPSIFESDTVTRLHRKAQHGYLAMTCLRYLNFAETWSKPEQGDGTDSSHPFIEYSTFYWDQHIRKAGCWQNQILSYVNEFFITGNQHFFAWTQVRERDKPDYQHQGSDASLMYYAARFGLTSTLKHVRSQGLFDFDVNVNGGPMGAALVPACAWNQLDAARLLIEWGADTNTYTFRAGDTLLNRAVSSGHEDMVELLIDNGAEVAKPGFKARNALHWACIVGNLDLASMFIEAGAPLDARDEDGFTALLWAFWFSKTGVAELLLEHGADLSIANAKGRTCLHTAAGAGSLEGVKLLLDNGADIACKDNGGWDPLQHASQFGQPQAVKLLLDNGADIANKDNEESDALHLASSRGHLQVVKLLLDNGADIASKDKFISEPLHYASHQGHLEVVKLLLDRGADIASKDYEGREPLHHAAFAGHSEVVKLLLDNGADIVSNDTDGKQPLLYASSKGHLETVKLLLDNGADVACKANAGLEPLHMAAVEGHPEVARLLLEEGANVASKHNGKKQPLHYASEHGHLQIVKLLLDHGADVCFAHPDGMSALALAVNNGHLDITRALLNAGATVSTVPKHGLSLLNLAALEGHLEIAKLLISYGAQPNEGGYGKSVLYTAITNGNEDFIELLLEFGADLFSKVSYGRSCLDWLKILYYDRDRFRRWIPEQTEATSTDAANTAYILDGVHNVCCLLLEGELIIPEIEYGKLGRCLLRLNMPIDARLAFSQCCHKNHSTGKLIHDVQCYFCNEDGLSGTLGVCKICPGTNRCERCTHGVVNDGVEVAKHPFCRNHDFFEVPMPEPADLLSTEMFQAKLKYWSQLTLSDIAEG